MDTTLRLFTWRDATAEDVDPECGVRIRGSVLLGESLHHADREGYDEIAAGLAVLPSSIESVGLQVLFDGRLIVDTRPVNRANLTSTAWRIVWGVGWVNTPVNVPFSEVKQGKYISWSDMQTVYDTLHDLVEYLLHRAKLVDADAWWPVHQVGNMWEIAHNYQLIEEPFVSEQEGLAWLEEARNNPWYYKNPCIVKGRRISWGAALASLNTSALATNESE